MVKRIFGIILLIALLLTATSCDTSVKLATFNIQNNSQHQITQIHLVSIPDKNYHEILKPGEKCTLMYKWVENPTWYARIKFSMNGEEYGTLYPEDLAADTTGRYKPLKHIVNGETVTVNIYDDHWEW